MSIAQKLTPLEVRTALGDFGPNNYLLQGEEFSDTRISLAIDLAIEAFNAMTPRIGVYNISTFPSKGILLDGTLWKLMEWMAAQLARNTMEYSDGGINVPIEERSPLYLDQAARFKESFETAAKSLKIQINLESGFGHILSDESFLPLW